jgi:hypothetical protein
MFTCQKGLSDIELFNFLQFCGLGRIIGGGGGSEA